MRHKIAVAYPTGHSGKEFGIFPANRSLLGCFLDVGLICSSPYISHIPMT
jgi:hypothetical protein